MKQKGLIAIMILMLSTLSIGCGQALKGSMEPVQSGLGLVEGDIPEGGDVSNIGDVESAEADKVASNIDSDLNSGKLGIEDMLDKLFDAADNLEDIKDKFDSGLGKIMEPLNKIKDKIYELKAKVQVEIDLLDPTVPEELILIEKLEKIQVKLDKAVAKVDKVADKILAGVQKIYDKIDDVIDKIQSNEIIYIILKSQLRSFKEDKVGSLRLLLLAFLAK